MQTGIFGTDWVTILINNYALGVAIALFIAIIAFLCMKWKKLGTFVKVLSVVVLIVLMLYFALMLFLFIGFGRHHG